ncbi:sporulation transcriptional regulator SpoIIID [Ruminococcus sp.]|uniref:sporulation transcriptional regulator SpoIIID n=1 Tax=Ruminococcus sp. TaxID=41978 RepID=UPI0025D95B27|nr:sporulation transcriptional regulator SpoIIID [Ruminococcus sp.]
MILSDKDRSVQLGEYVVSHRATVRAAAKVFGISKSTVHKDLTERLPKISPQLFKSVKEILEENKRERHIRGGIATKHKYEEQLKRSAVRK